MSTYTQVKLVLENKEQVAWIPTQYAVRNKWLRIHGHGDWEVVEVYVTRTAQELDAHDHATRVYERVLE